MHNLVTIEASLVREHTDGDVQASELLPKTSQLWPTSTVLPPVSPVVQIALGERA